MVWRIILLLALLGINKGVTQTTDCRRENTCDCCKGNPDDGTRVLSDICDNKIGVTWRCKYGCFDGYWGHRCFNSCPSSCISCHRNYSIESVCFQCADGYYNGVGVKDCSTPCPVNCAENQCDGTTGKCSQGCTSYNWRGEKCNVCADTWYGNNCDIRCPDVCKDRMCDGNGECTTGCADENFTGSKCDQCINGKYGENCDIGCPVNCKDDVCLDNDGTCAIGCKMNYAGDRCDVCSPYYYGAQCKNECNNCLNGKCDRTTGLCLECDHGKFGEFCDNPCSLGCKNSVCERNDATCLEGCNSGYTGDKCCVFNDNCEKCSSTSECSGCKIGYYGGSCSIECPKNCDAGCDKMSGYCRNCVRGFYGESCSLVCSSSCYESECSKNNGVCISCINGYYGQTCDMKCPENCVNKICDQENGMCLRCKNGYYGSSCNMTCSLNCKDGLCGQDTGYCRLGCATSAEGNCEQLSTSPETTDRQTSETVTTSEMTEMLDRQTIIMISGLVGGFVLIMIIVNVELFILKRILSNRKSTEKTYMQPSRSTDDNDPESMYVNPDMVTDGDL